MEASHSRTVLSSTRRCQSLAVRRKSNRCNRRPMPETHGPEPRQGTRRQRVALAVGAHHVFEAKGGAGFALWSGSVLTKQEAKANTKKPERQRPALPEVRPHLRLENNMACRNPLFARVTADTERDRPVDCRYHRLLRDRQFYRLARRCRAAAASWRTARPGPFLASVCSRAVASGVSSHSTARMARCQHNGSGVG